MSNKEYSLSPEMMVSVEEIIENARIANYAILLAIYQLEAEGLTEQDMVKEILEAGGYQTEEGVFFDDAVIIGAVAIGRRLGLV